MGYSIFSFFSGSGFLDLGFETSGFSIDLVNEYSSAFINAYKYSRKIMGMAEPKYGYQNNDVNDFLDIRSNELCHYIKNERDMGNIVGFIGGPPCPDFSVAGKQRGRNGDNGKLSLTYIKLIIAQKPDFFLFENVKGLWSTSKHRAFYEDLKLMLSNAGYMISNRLTNSIEFGAPQDRDRILLFGINRERFNNIPIMFFPWTRHIIYNVQATKSLGWPTQDIFSENCERKCPDNIPKELTVQYWFDLNDVTNHPNTRDCFVPRQGLKKMLVVQEGDVKKKSLKRPHRWRYSPTVAYGNNEVHLHPYKARRLNVAEALALQSMPKEFVLPPNMSLTDKFKTIGNGVPYLMAKGIATTIKDYLNEISQ